MGSFPAPAPATVGLVVLDVVGGVLLLVRLVKGMDGGFVVAVVASVVVVEFLVALAALL
jgi:hypothetical protein